MFTNIDRRVKGAKRLGFEKRGVDLPVGPRIRALREARAVSVRAFAKEAELSSGLISQVERGVTDPSLETLRRLAQALDVPIFSLFQDDGSVEAARVVRGERRMLIRSPYGEITYSRVSAGGGSLEVLEGVLQPGGSSSAEPWSHPSEECAIVLAGRLTVRVSEQEWVLDEGDSCSFDSRRAHRYLNEEARPCRFLLSVTPPSY